MVIIYHVVLLQENVPHIIAFGDFFTAVGAGMTVKYFPLLR